MSEGMIVGLVFFIIGVVFALVATILVILHKKKRKCYNMEVQATIVETKLYRKKLGGVERFYYPVYEYQYKGVTYQNESNLGTNGRPKVGKVRKIYLNPENPEEYIEKRFLTYLHIVIVTAISVVFGFVGLMILLAGMF